MNPRHPLAFLVLGASLSLPSLATAKPKPGCADAVRFTSDAILTLAIVDGSTIARDKGQCADEFFPEGQRWSALDRFGKVVGVVANENEGKHGMHFRKVSGGMGAHVYVRNRKTPFASAEWKAPAGEREKVVAAVGAKIPREVVFFQSAEKRFAVVVERSTFSVAELEKGKWRRRFNQKTFAGFPVYAVRAVLDMNDDGMPEIVQHFSEYDSGAGFEVVLARKPNGDWHEIASNEDTGP